MPQQIVAGIESFQMLSIPFFILAAQIMNSGTITERLFHFAEEVVGWLRGGLAYVNVLASMIFAGISGAAVADASGLGLIEIKAMKDHGYKETFAVAVTAASSMVGPIIPPSIMLIIYGHIANLSIGALFLAGILPGILAGVCMMLYIAYCVSRGKVLDKPAKKFSLIRLLRSFVSNFFVLLLPPFLLWAILSGNVTPTEAGALASFYALVLSFFYEGRKMFGRLPAIILDTMRNTAQILFILGATQILVWIMTRAQTSLLVSEYFFSITDNKILLLMLINIFLLVIGAVMNTLPAMLVIIPLLSPIGMRIGLDPIHLGLIVVFNLMVGMITPPFGMGLFIMASITGMPIKKVIKACAPFLIPLIIALMIITYVPEVSTLIPRLFM